MTARQNRRLWLCADDYGMSPGVDGAIRDLLGRRRINATSVMVVAPGFAAPDAAALTALDDPQRRSAIGLHLTLTAPFHPATRAYRPLTSAGEFLPLSRMLAAGLTRRLDPDALAAETAAQLGMFKSLFGRPPDFIDGHQHVHLLPQVGDALLAIMKNEAPGAWIRQCGRAVPFWKRWGDPKGLLLDALSRRLRSRCKTYGVRTNPAFAGTYDFKSAAPYERLFGSFLDDLPDGGLVMCHPGQVDAQLRRLDELTTRREQEYDFFKGELFSQLLASRGYELA